MYFLQRAKFSVSAAQLIGTHAICQAALWTDPEKEKKRLSYFSDLDDVVKLRSHLKPVAEWRERLIGRCFPVVTFICRITVREQGSVRVGIWKIQWAKCSLCNDFTWEVQSVGVLGRVEFHHAPLVPVVALLDLSACHRAGRAGVNLTGENTERKKYKQSLHQSEHSGGHEGSRILIEVICEKEKEECKDCTFSQETEPSRWEKIMKMSAHMDRRETIWEKLQVFLFCFVFQMFLIQQIWQLNQWICQTSSLRSRAL